jgi:hypothetical protein
MDEIIGFAAVIQIFDREVYAWRVHRIAVARREKFWGERKDARVNPDTGVCEHG